MGAPPGVAVTGLCLTHGIARDVRNTITLFSVHGSLGWMVTFECSSSSGSRRCKFQPIETLLPTPCTAGYGGAKPTPSAAAGTRANAVHSWSTTYAPANHRHRDEPASG